jgi:membrane-associated protease RseP (regulator of RpoE activity)
LLELLTAIITLMGQVIIDTITSPLFISVYLLLFTIVAWQYKRIESSTEKIINYNDGLFLHSALISTITGILGGFIGSLLLIMAGIDLGNIGLGHLWLLALILMLVNPRFLCFAYAAGLLSLSAYFFSYPNLSVPHLLGLVAILHLIESFMIGLEGSVNPVPIYIKKDDVIRGGFNLQKFWPLPLIALVGGPGIYSVNGFFMPDWWPLFPNTQSWAEPVMSLLPVVAVLGYGDITTTSTPVKRIKKSSLYLFIYSVLLFIFTYLAGQHKVFCLAAAVFAPLGHEAVIWLGWREEDSKEPLYIKPARGVKVLTTRYGSPARAAHIQEGDIILAVNGQEVDFFPAARELMSVFKRPSLTVLRGNKEIEIILPGSHGQESGIIPVPENYVARYMVTPCRKLFSFIPLTKKHKPIKF